MTLVKPRILVIGGLGNFGARICKRLMLSKRFEVIAASRSGKHSSVHRFPSAEEVATAYLDIDAPNLAQQLSALTPTIVIHCAGPFQSQGYQVALACCAAGAHYIDIADGRAYVSNFPASLNEHAKAAGICAISGASTVPGLSSAVVDSLARDFSRLDEINMAIAPGQQAPRGVATIQAVFSYAGLPFKRLKNGQWGPVYGWQDLRTIRFQHLGKRLAASCDVPDLALFPARYPTVKTVEFHAALELQIQHLALWCAAALRRLGVALPMARWAAALDRFSTRFLDRFGHDQGGMRVAVRGLTANGQPGGKTWHLTAPNGDGPEIPTLAAVLLAEKLADAGAMTPGAYTATGLLKLDEFEPEFRRWGFTTEIEESR
jgi:saccharopine dehydrogenase-like NADP-dependent oxidoreductase